MVKRNKKRQNRFLYALARAICAAVSRFLFRPRVLVNELKGKKGPFVVIANHQASLDFVNLITRTRMPLSFVISHAFYSTLPVKGYMDRIGVIPKQQFQTGLSELRTMKNVCAGGGGLVVYPAGLMCEDGSQSPLPVATHKFLVHLGVDVYLAKTEGAYFVMPKWAKDKRRGPTTMSITKLLSTEQLHTLPEEELERKVHDALSFDAYKDQERLRFRYKNGHSIRGLSGILPLCPHCKTDFSLTEKDESTLHCTACGFEERCDEYGFLHNEKGIGPEIRYVSDMGRIVHEEIRARMEKGTLTTLSLPCRIHMIDYKKQKFVPVGQATVTLTENAFLLSGTLAGEEKELSLPTLHFASLPFTPNACFEIQNGKDVYRCYPDDPRAVMTVVHMVRIFYAQRNASVNAVPT